MTEAEEEEEDSITHLAIFIKLVISQFVTFTSVV